MKGIFRFGPWVVWVLGFYTIWVMLLFEGDRFSLLPQHGEIAVAMLLGSYVAGSTPMGGGTIGFPILVFFFDQPAALGRDFSFAVQAIGMTSASILIICSRRHLEWVLIRWALLGSLIGTPFGIVVVAPHVSGVFIKILFAIVWASFGVLHLYKTNSICANIGETPAAHAFDRIVGLLVGFGAGSTVVAITGVGIDMVLYAVMVLLMRCDLKSAIPSSVIVMAFTSIVGIATKSLVSEIQSGVFENWLAAAPVVVIGAPLGALIVDKMNRKLTLIFVALLCIGQFVWAMYEVFDQMGWTWIFVAVFSVGLMNFGFEWIWRQGDRLQRRSGVNKLDDKCGKRLEG